MTRVQWAALTVPDGESVDVVADDSTTTPVLSIESPSDIPASGGTPVIASVYRAGGNVTVPWGDLVKIPFDTVQEDPSSWWDAASQSFRLPAGTYVLTAQVWWHGGDMDGTGIVGLEMLGSGGGSLPGGLGPDSQFTSPPNGEQARQQITLPFRLAAADAVGISVFVTQTNTPETSRTIIGNGCWFVCYGWPAA